MKPELTRNKDGSIDKRFSWKGDWYICRNYKGQEWLTSKPNKYGNVEKRLLLTGTYTEAKKAFDRHQKIYQECLQNLNKLCNKSEENKNCLC